MLTVSLPPGLRAAREYATRVVLDELLGVPYRVAPGEIAPGGVRIEDEGRTLELGDIFFARAADAWLRPGSVPAASGRWDAVAALPEIDHLPGPLPYLDDGAKSPLLAMENDRIRCGLDVFGTAFLLLTRYEEAVIGARDEHDRVPLASLAPFQRDHLDRPLVDEHVGVLWALLRRLWPRLTRRPRQFRVVPTHDVDQPFAYAFLPPHRLLRSMAGDVARRRSVRRALRTAATWMAVRAGALARDPCNQFDWIMQESEKRNLRSAFYFICHRSGGAMDADYDIDHPALVDLLREIAAREHEVGLHGSYHSYRDVAQLGRELAHLQKVAARAGVRQTEWGGRQHYLRWHTPDSIRQWDQAGLAYDSTLTFAKRAGFRCGTCHEFPTFDLAAQQALRIRERPLVVMECSVTDARYMGLGETSAACDTMLGLKRVCRRWDGNFTLLWHNSRLAAPHQRDLYLSVLDG